MFTNVSWQQFITTMATVVSIYYLVVLFIFYKTELVQLFRTIRNRITGLRNEAEDIKSDMHPGTEKTLSQLQTDIANFLEQSAARKYIKDEVLLGLGLILGNYDTILLHDWRASLNSFMLNKVENYCSIHLNDAEIDQLWGKKGGDGTFFIN